MKKDLHQIIKRLRHEGLIVAEDDRGGKHRALLLCNGIRYACPRSPSDHRSLLNVECDIRRLTRT